MITLKSDEEIDIMKKSGQLAAEILDMIEGHIKPGISTQQINDLCHTFTTERNAISAPLNYRGFPKSVCTSINNVVCHGIPTGKDVLKEGDIINIDVTPILNGYHGDSSRMYGVGKISNEAQNLIDTTKQCLDLAIGIVKPNVRIGDLGAIIQEHAEKKGYSVVREFVGHGIGKVFHEDPQIAHYGKKGTGIRLEPGMTFTIEPMINQGHWKTKLRRDGWTAVTVDGKLSAQFEHTLAIRSDGSVDILTQN